MDMDMDIPLPEELELLEAQLHDHHEDYLDLEPPEPYPEDEQQQQQQQRSHFRSPPSDDDPPSSTPGVQSNGQKRSRTTDGPDALLVLEESGPSDEKRSRTTVEEDLPNEADEDWLRYSPPPEESEPMVVEEPAVVEEEKFVWRYASEIDGDFIPVTAPSGGDRVYAKINRFEKVEQPKKKFDVVSQSGGRILLFGFRENVGKKKKKLIAVVLVILASAWYKWVTVFIVIIIVYVKFISIVVYWSSVNSQCILDFCYIFQVLFWNQ